MRFESDLRLVYEQGAATVHWMIEAEGGRRRKALLHWMTDLHAGRARTGDAETRLGMPAEKAGEAIVEWCRSVSDGP